MILRLFVILKWERLVGHHKSGDVFRAEAHIVAAHRDIYADSEQGDLYAAIDVVRDEVMHRLTSDKGKRLSSIRRGGTAVKNMIKGLWRGRGSVIMLFFNLSINQPTIMDSAKNF